MKADYTIELRSDISGKNGLSIVHSNGKVILTTPDTGHANKKRMLEIVTRALMAPCYSVVDADDVLPPIVRATDTFPVSVTETYFKGPEKMFLS